MIINKLLLGLGLFNMMLGLFNMITSLILETDVAFSIIGFVCIVLGIVNITKSIDNEDGWKR